MKTVWISSTFETKDNLIFSRDIVYFVLLLFFLSFFFSFKKSNFVFKGIRALRLRNSVKSVKFRRMSTEKELLEIDKRGLENKLCLRQYLTMLHVSRCQAKCLWNVCESFFFFNFLNSSFFTAHFSDKLQKFRKALSSNEWKWKETDEWNQTGSSQDHESTSGCGWRFPLEVSTRLSPSRNRRESLSLDYLRDT